MYRKNLNYQGLADVKYCSKWPEKCMPYCKNANMILKKKK